MPFKMQKMLLFFFQKKKIIKKKICVPALTKFSDRLPETHLFFYLALYQILISSQYSGAKSLFYNIDVLQSWWKTVWIQLIWVNTVFRSGYS